MGRGDPARLARPGDLPRPRRLPGRLAAARGYRYLQVDASPDSRPILERLGFIRLARTTPYVWEPGAPG